MSLMRAEAAEAAAVVARQLRENHTQLAALGARLRQHPPRVVVTCARGSSDHAATYARYLIETRTGVLTASVSPSISSVYGVEQDLRNALMLAISQSGRSPDLLASVAAAKRSGALVLAFCNDSSAPLCAAADYAISLRAGEERSVAATKSFIATLSAILQLTAEWSAQPDLLAASAQLPAALEAARALDWSAALPVLRSAEHLYVIGRGLGLGVAQELALKAKETCGLHAEAHSGAEVQHGPLALLGRNFPALLLTQDDATRAGLELLARELVSRKVEVLMAGGNVAGVIRLPTLALPPSLAPIVWAATAYPMLAELSVLRGHDPDRPPHLRKVTETV